MAEENKDSHRLQEIEEWETNHGHEHPDHARDVRDLLRIIERMQDHRIALIPSAAHLHGMADRVDAAAVRCEGMIETMEGLVAVIADDISMFSSIATRLLTGESIQLGQLTPDERQWVERIPERLKK